MSPQPAVSVIIPVYNSERFIRQMLKSVLTQTTKNYEVIIVDDGSNDASMSIVNELARRYGRVRIITQRNQGPGVARNVGLEHALGEYIAFLDADDFIEPTLIEHAYARAKAADADIVVYRARLFDMEDEAFHDFEGQWDAQALPSEVTPQDYADNLFDLFKNWPWDKLFKRSFLKENEIIFPPLHRTEDLLFTCSALAVAKRIALLDETLYAYRVNNATSSTQSIDQAPTDFYESCRLLKVYLEYRNLYETYRVTYANWVSLCAIVNLLGVKTIEGFTRAYELLHIRGMHILGLDTAKAEDFADRKRYEMVRCLIEDDLTAGLFRFWHYDLELADKRREKDRKTAFEHGLSSLSSSTSYKLGSTLLKVPIALKDRRSSKGTAGKNGEGK